MSKFEAKVSYKGYEDVASSTDPVIVARVLSCLIHGMETEDPTAKRVRELEEKLESAEASASSANYWKKQAEEKLEKLKKEIKEKTDE